MPLDDELVRRVVAGGLTWSDAVEYLRIVQRGLATDEIRVYFDRDLVERKSVEDRLYEEASVAAATGLPSYTAYLHEEQLIESTVAVFRGTIQNGTVALLAGIALFLTFLLGIRSVGDLFSVSWRGLLFDLVAWVLFGAGTALMPIFARVKRRWLTVLPLFAVLVMAVIGAGVLVGPLQSETSRADVWLLLGMGATAGFAVGHDVLRRQMRSWLRELPRVRSLLLACWASGGRRAEWKKEVLDVVVVPITALTINDLLGGDLDSLLVEQDSTGLRRLQDPLYRVETASAGRLATAIAGMEGGCIGLVGPRGAGKSTLIRKYCPPEDQLLLAGPGGVTVWAPAPAYYAPNEFLVELLYQSCAAYIGYHGRHSAKRSHWSARGWPRRRQVRRHAGRVLRGAMSLSLVGYAGFQVYQEHSTRILRLGRQGVDGLSQLAGWVGAEAAAHRRLAEVTTLIAAFLFFPRPRSRLIIEQDQLVRRAREYQRRLRSQATRSRGIDAGVAMRGVGTTFRRGTSETETAFSFPELVSEIRSFLAAVAKAEFRAGRKVFIGIDELDRIGSATDAERFLGEIKTIFGIENCHFVVSLADDIEYEMAPRGASGRSIMDHAFDAVVVVDPLTVEEAQELLGQRVIGFTRPFVEVVHCLSGGLPRELIRLTRRMVDLNQGATPSSRPDPPPRLPGLVCALARQELLNALRTSRGRMTRYDTVDTDGYLHRMAMLIELLAAQGQFEVGLPDEITTESLFGAPREANHHLVPMPDRAGSDGLDRIAAEASAWCYFATTIVRLFAVNDPTQRRYPNETFNKLAAARREIGMSPASCRASLDRFHAVYLSCR